MAMPTEAWQRGPLPDVDPFLMPVAPSFVQVKEDLDRLAACVSEDQLWQRPNGAASIGVHIRHIAGSTERLLTYARGDALTPDQLNAARAEAEATGSLRVLIREAHAALDRALAQVRATPKEMLLAQRLVGRAKLPSTTLGLLVHAAEHATRHAGQATTTAIVLGGNKAANKLSKGEGADRVRARLARP
jgi:uncharacterized damage-inducible protein DinB